MPDPPAELLDRAAPRLSPLWPALHRLRQSVKRFAQEVLGSKSPEELERLETEAANLESDLLGPRRAFF